MPRRHPAMSLIASPRLGGFGSCDLSQLTMQIFASLGGAGLCQGVRPTYSPLTGEQLALVSPTTVADVPKAVALSQQAFAAWHGVASDLREVLVARFAQGLRDAQAPLAQLIVLETGKRLAEALAEVEQMVTVCDLVAKGQGAPSPNPDASEPLLGPQAMVSAFNLPLWLWTQQACLAIVAGNSVIWQPSGKVPLTALACQAVLTGALAAAGGPAHLSQVLIGGPEVRAALAAQLPLREIDGAEGAACAVVTPLADLEHVVAAVTANAVAMAGQGRAALRQLFVHRSLYAPLLHRLCAAYGDLGIGNPLHSDALVGPLIDREAFEAMGEALALARAKGAIVHGGERQMIVSEAAYYVRPALVEGAPTGHVLAPILYLQPFDDLATCLDQQPSGPIGLFAQDQHEAARLLAPLKGRAVRIHLCAADPQGTKL